MKRLAHILLLTLLLGSFSAFANAAEQPGKAALFFYRAAAWVDNFQLRGLDTSYIGLPEFRWRVALNNGEVGVHSSYTNWVDPKTPITLLTQTTPSVGIGFNAGFRGFGGGYTWDVMNAYTTNWNISLGSKGLGLEFMRNVSTNVEGQFSVDGAPSSTIPDMKKGEMRLANTYLGAWYVLNRTHYAHNAITKQDYIQKKTAGSLILSVAYMSSEMTILDSLKYIKDEDMKTILGGMTGMITRQVAIGIGYGINYTPNKGKVLLHASAHMQLVCYSVNHISYIYPDSVYLPGVPQYMLRPMQPVHVTGNMRAGVSWEINRWVHLGVWAQARNLQFASRDRELTALDIRAWSWQTNLTIGVRFGASQKRMHEVLGEPAQPVPEPTEKTSRLPRWITDYFFSPSN